MAFSSISHPIINEGSKIQIIPTNRRNTGLFYFSSDLETMQSDFFQSFTSKLPMAR